MQIHVAVGVVAQLVARIAPVAQHLHAFRLYRPVHFQLVLVDESHHRDIRPAQLRHQARMPVGQSRDGLLIEALPRQIVDGHRDAALRCDVGRRRLCAGFGGLGQAGP